MGEHTGISAEPFHPWEYIQDELDARGWSLEDLAMKMPAPKMTDLALNLLTLQLVEATSDPTFKHRDGCRIGHDTNARIAAAFGQSVEFWDNIETLYIRARDAKKLREAEPQSNPEGRET